MKDKQEIEFERVYETHRVAFYRGWIIVETADGEFWAIFTDGDRLDEKILADEEEMRFYCEWGLSADTLAELQSKIDRGNFI
ncbi:MAG: hypothetical protein EOM54_11285 [Clostridia bacterium]|nr:hypothetical protein [Clostridia bacterium]